MEHKGKRAVIGMRYDRSKEIVVALTESYLSTLHTSCYQCCLCRANAGRLLHRGAAYALEAGMRRTDVYKKSLV